MRIQRESTRTLDKLDRHILRILQQEGRISMKDLGERVGLSVTPCIERVKRMVGSSRVDLQACKLEYSIVSPK